MKVLEQIQDHLDELLLSNENSRNNFIIKYIILREKQRVRYHHYGDVYFKIYAAKPFSDLSSVVKQSLIYDARLCTSNHEKTF